MHTFVALLRGVNVGGHQKLTNETLRKVCEQAGFTSVRTYLQSGNVVVRGNERSAKRVAAAIGSALTAMAGLSVDVIVRTGAEMRDVIANNPLASPDRAGNKLVVLFLGGAIAPPALAALEEEQATGELIELRGRELYAYFPEGMGRSKLAEAFAPKKLGVSCTARNWNSVTALHKLVEELESS
ncbi:MAG TPA: DUF1697 domain-containing protein [Thermoanaerobaculia bacterium]|jgi:uncharacterized protein (DUF1697 family)